MKKTSSFSLLRPVLFECCFQMRAYPEFVNIFSHVFTTCTNSSLQVLCGLFHITLSEAEVKMPFLKYRRPSDAEGFTECTELIAPQRIAAFPESVPCIHGSCCRCGCVHRFPSVFVLSFLASCLFQTLCPRVDYCASGNWVNSAVGARSSE